MKTSASGITSVKSTASVTAVSSALNSHRARAARRLNVERCGRRRQALAGIFSVEEGRHAFQARALEPADAEREHEHTNQPDEHRRDDRDEQLAGAHLQCRRRPRRWSAPRQHVHRSRGERGNAGEAQRAHRRTLIERQHRRDGHHERARAGTVEMRDGRDRGRAQRDPHRIGAHHPDERADDRLEQAGVVHHTEVDHREGQERRNRRHAADPVHRVRSQAAREPADDGSGDRHEGERNKDRCDAEQDEQQQGGDRCDAEQREHGGG